MEEERKADATSRCYESNSTRSMERTVVKITKDQIGDHPFLEEGYCQQLGYSGVEIALPPGYTNGRLIEKKGKTYLVFQDNPIKTQTSSA